jgi:hypothetical protein
MGRHEGAGRIARLRRVFAMSQELGGKAIYFFSKVSVLAGPWMRPSTGLE